MICPVCKNEYKGEYCTICSVINKDYSAPPKKEITIFKIDLLKVLKWLKREK